MYVLAKNFKKVDNAIKGLGDRPQSMCGHLWGEVPLMISCCLHKKNYRLEKLLAADIEAFNGAYEKLIRILEKIII
ncbi:MAG: hypothetical protein LBK40_09425 [Spirochaetaceae bacterium]|jgi:hypothetical protein|nr:hypothetical protein [Spirochaetaceae bacterium]